MKTPVIPATDTPPALLIDIDGVLNPITRCQDGCDCHPGWTVEKLLDVPGGPYRMRLNPSHGEALLELAESTGAELVWASFWTSLANVYIGPVIGLPELPWVPMPPIPRWGPDSAIRHGAWKARHVVKWADGREFAWLEDEPDVPDELIYLAHIRHIGPHLVIPVDSRTGLNDHHLTEARTVLTTFAKYRAEEDPDCE
jgi:hypothetical protein